jgi:hypothetical protein
MPLVIPPTAARAFRAAVGKCRAARSRDPAVPVLVRARAGTLTLFASLGEVGLALTVTDAIGTGKAVMPLDALDRPGSAELPAVQQADVPTPPLLPETMAEITHLVLAALHEAGRTAAREQVRYALTRTQVRGSAGTIVATDGKQALVQGGFTFPFPEDVLVPAIPVFGCKELAGQNEVRIGMTASHLVVMAGPWTVWLLIDREGRFPDVEGAMPRSRLTTTLELQLPSAVLDGLRKIETGDAASLTLELGPTVLVRAARADGAPPVEIAIPGATVQGPPLRVAVQRSHWLRALALGLGRFKFTGADRPWIACDATRTYLAAALDPASAIGSDQSQAVAPLSPLPDPPRRTLMSARPTPDPSRNGHADPPTDANGDLADPLVEAEGLRAALADAATRAARLVATLKQFKRERRALVSAWSSLKQLNLGS